MSLMPGTEWRGPLPSTNFRAGAMAPVVGVTVHHMDGSWQSAEGRFKTPGSSASAHFGVRYDGSIIQWVDTADVAYHACGANWHGWVGIENESSSDPAHENDPLTDAQVVAVRKIIAWLGVASVPASSPTSGGVGYHRQFPGACTNDDWGSTACPGDGIVAQIPAICSPPAPELPKEVDMALYMFAADGVSIWRMGGSRRHVTGPEWAAAQYLFKLVTGKDLTPFKFSQEWWDSVPEAGTAVASAFTVTSTVKPV